MRNMILWNLKAGTSLSVLDPNGTLLQDILEHIPKERTNDVIFFDLKQPDKCNDLQRYDGPKFEELLGSRKIKERADSPRPLTWCDLKIGYRACRSTI